MNQAAHIFAKDTRHLRWEIGISLFLMAAYLWSAPCEWRPVLHSQPPGMTVEDVQKLVGLFTLVLLPVSWWLLITRAVQDENLVGTQQWWITRPYQWGSLLASKFLFFSAFLLAPMLIAQSVMLAEGGFSPLTHVPGLIASLILLLAYLILPLMAVASVTGSLARTTLTILGITVAGLILLVGVAFLLNLHSFAVPWVVSLIFAIVLAGFIAAISWLYAQRRVWPTRLAMIAIPLVVAAAALFSANPLFMAFTYPRANTQVQLMQGPADPSQKSWYFSQSAGITRIGFTVPVQVSGLDQTDAIAFDGVQVSVEAPDGRHWNSAWESSGGTPFLVSEDPSKVAQVRIQIDGDFFNAEKKNSVTLHLRFAISQMRAATPLHLSLPSQEFTVPDFGICAPIPSTQGAGFRELSCRNALRQPENTYVQVQWSDDPCTTPVASRSTVAEGAWAGELSPALADFGFNSVHETPIRLSGGEHTENNHTSPRFLCPGSPIAFTPYHRLSRFEQDLTITGYHLPEL
jgi:hypothetical protein